jgi:SAM-dependent methyltransferase
VHDFVSRWVDDHDLSYRSHLDVGSFDVNGSCRGFFNGVSVGVDMRAGPNVDQVANSHALPFADWSFAVVTCTELLEHDDVPWQTVAEIHRVLQPGGVALVTARGYDERGCFPVHDYPDDLWRFSVNGMIALLHTRFDTVVAGRDPECPGVLAVASR